ncbi:MAG: hypothetical protein ABFS56_30765 [Pseudomonadota bacterium]
MLCQKMRRGKNWIIVEALKEYLEKHYQRRPLVFEHAASRDW